MFYFRTQLNKPAAGKQMTDLVFKVGIFLTKTVFQEVFSEQNKGKSKKILPSADFGSWIKWVKVPFPVHTRVVELSG